MYWYVYLLQVDLTDDYRQYLIFRMKDKISNSLQ